MSPTPCSIDVWSVRLDSTSACEAVKGQAGPTVVPPLRPVPATRHLMPWLLPGSGLPGGALVGEEGRCPDLVLCHHWLGHSLKPLDHPHHQPHVHRTAACPSAGSPIPLQGACCKGKMLALAAEEQGRLLAQFSSVKNPYTH